MIFALGLFLIATGSAAPALDPAVDSGLGWTATRLDLHVSVLPAQRRLEIHGTIALKLELERSTGPALVINGDEPGARFLRIEAPPGARIELNRPFPAREGVLLSHVRFDEELERGATLELGFEVECTGRGDQFVVDDEVALASWVVAWYPIPRPDLESQRQFSRLLSIPGTTSFHLPAGWTSLSNGSRTERIEGEGDVVETWTLDEPVARSFAAGPYRVGVHEVDGRSFSVYLLEHEPEEAHVQAESLARAIEAMEERFGPFPYPTFGIAEVPEAKVGFYGSSEQGFLMAASSAFRYGTNLPLFAHEASHAWWGNLINNHGPGAKLLGESLAQYGAVIAIETIEGEEAATEFLRFSRKGYNSFQCARGYFQILAAGNDKPLGELASDPWDHNLSDSKGHWLYHMLRYRVGDEAFFATMRALIERFAGDSISLEDLQAAFHEAAPDRELERFFEQWLEREGAPILEVEWSAGGAGDPRVTGMLRQTHGGDPYHLYVELDVVTKEGSVRRTVEIGAEETPFELEVDAEPLDVLIDPRHRILRWTPEYGKRPVR
ncbi:MAG: M1 family aminopeptidase [Planctomycetota bacterium]|nr:M1 family aminopeptidase [Planctomycetota bacterium]